VFGDIGTSPLYTMKESFIGPHPMAVNALHIFGVLSLIFWSLMMIVTIKYVIVAMRADNKGEGGTFALLSLISRTLRGKRWTPILNHADENGVDVCYEIHPGEDLHDGITFEMFLERVKNHPRANMLYDPSHYVLQCLDYLDNIDIYKDRIKMFHVKDAEFNPTGRQGVYGGYQGWVERAGRFRSLGDGQVDFGAVFSKMTANNFDGWAVVEWECALKHPEDGAREGAEFVKAHIIRVTEKAFDDFAAGGTDQAANRRMLGL